MSDIKPKVANVRLKPGATPITISGFAYVGGGGEPLTFPTEKRQIAGWKAKDPKRIVKNYGDRYELFTPGLNVEGGK